MQENRQNRQPEACTIRSIPAQELESAVLYEIKAALKSPELIGMIARMLGEKDKTTTKVQRERHVRRELQNFETLWDELFMPEQRQLLNQILERIDVSEDGVNLHLKKNELTQWVMEAQEHDTGHDNHSTAA